MKNEEWSHSTNSEPCSMADDANIRDFDSAKGTLNTAPKQKWTTPTMQGPFPLELLAEKHEAINGELSEYLKKRTSC